MGIHCSAMQWLVSEMFIEVNIAACDSAVHYSALECLVLVVQLCSSAVFCSAEVQCVVVH